MGTDKATCIYFIKIFKHGDGDQGARIGLRENTKCISEIKSHLGLV